MCLYIHPPFHLCIASCKLCNTTSTAPQYWAITENNSANHNQSTQKSAKSRTKSAMGSHFSKSSRRRGKEDRLPSNIRHPHLESQNIKNHQTATGASVLPQTHHIRCKKKDKSEESPSLGFQKDKHGVVIPKSSDLRVTFGPQHGNDSAVAIESKTKRNPRGMIRKKTPLPHRRKHGVERVEEISKHFYTKVLPPCLEYCHILERDPEGHADPWKYDEIVTKLEVEVLFELAAVDSDGSQEFADKVLALKEAVWKQQDAVEIENVWRASRRARGKALDNLLSKVEIQKVVRTWEFPARKNYKL